MSGAFLWASRAAAAAFAESWRSARGNPKIHYRFRCGDLVIHDGLGNRSRIIRRCWCDENYDLENGWTIPGHLLSRANRG